MATEASEPATSEKQPGENGELDRWKSKCDNILAARIETYNRRVASAGIRPRIEVADDGRVIVPRNVPREVREYAREVLLSVGIPVLLEVVLDGKKIEQVAAVRVLKDLGMPHAVSHMDGEGRESLPAVIMLPPMAPPPVPPEHLRVADVPAPSAVSATGVARVREALGRSA